MASNFSTWLFEAVLGNAGRLYDSSRPIIPVRFDESLSQRQDNLKSFNDLLDEATRNQKEKLQKCELASEAANAELNAAVAAGNIVAAAEAKKKRKSKENRRAEASKKVREIEVEFYLAQCKKGEVSLEATKGIKFLSDMYISQNAKPPTLEQLASLGDIVSDGTKAELVSFYDKTTSTAAKNKALATVVKSNSKCAFKYLLSVDMATEVEKNARNKHAKELAAKLWNDVDTKYFWSTVKGKNMFSYYGNRFCCQWFLPSVVGKVAKAFGQLEIVDSVDKNNEKAKKIRDLLDKVESSEGSEREKFIKQIWETT